MKYVHATDTIVRNIKRAAKKIRREHGITHSEALDIASKVAGFSNFHHLKTCNSKNSDNSREAYDYKITSWSYAGMDTLGYKLFNVTYQIYKNKKLIETFCEGPLIEPEIGTYIIHRAEEYILKIN